MTWLLDTNACIRFLNGRSARLRARFDVADPAQIYVCSVVKAEMYFGAALARDPAEALAEQQTFLSRFVSLAFDDRAAVEYALIRADLRQRGALIGPNDMMIAAICRASGLTLVTHNVGEFGRVAGLVIDDWEA